MTGCTAPERMWIRREHRGEKMILRGVSQLGPPCSLAFRSSSGHGGPHRHLSWPSTSLDTASMSPVPFTRLRRPLASYQVANGAVCS